jgi:cell wall assembly regulator SMI1
MGVLQSHFSGNTHSIDLSNYPSGQYWVVITHQSGHSESHPLVKE